VAVFGEAVFEELDSFVVFVTCHPVKDLATMAHADNLSRHVVLVTFIYV
jgi:hypothetical protein